VTAHYAAKASLLKEQGIGPYGARPRRCSGAGRYVRRREKGNEAMPYINVKITREGVTPRQKREIITGVTRLMTDILNKDPQRTHVVIDEIDTDNWGVGGEPVTESRKQGI
jgi:4-oxalocrotonate tautomerase